MKRHNQEDHGGKRRKLDSEGERTVECGQMKSNRWKVTGGRQRGENLPKPKMSAYEKIRERNIAEREEMLAELKSDQCQIKTNLWIEVDNEKGERRNAVSTPGLILYPVTCII